MNIIVKWNVFGVGNSLSKTKSQLTKSVFEVLELRKTSCSIILWIDHHKDNRNIFYCKESKLPGYLIVISSGASLLNLSETETLKRSSSTQSLSVSPTQPQVMSTPKFVRTHSRSRSDDSGLINFIPMLRSASSHHLSDLASGTCWFTVLWIVSFYFSKMWNSIFNAI